MRRLRHWRDPVLALALSRSVALGVPQFDNLTFALSSLMCRQQKKCSTFQFVSVCFKLFRLFFLFLLVFTFCCWFSLCQVVPSFVGLLRQVLLGLPWFYLLCFRMSKFYFLKVFDGLEVPVRGWTFYLVSNRLKLTAVSRCVACSYFVFGYLNLFFCFSFFHLFQDAFLL